MNDEADSGRAPTIMSRANIRRGLKGFIPLTVLGLGGVYAYSVRAQAEDLVVTLSASFFALALLAAVFDWFLGGLRHHVFLSHLVPGSRLWLPVRADLVGRFTGAVTPSQTGGAPGQIYVLYRGGIPLPAILSTLSVNLMATTVFFIIVGGAATLLVGDRVDSIVIRQLVLWGFVGVMGVTAFLALAMTRPDLAVRPVAAITRRLEGRTGTLARTTRSVGIVLVDSADRYKASCSRCLREWRMLPAIAVALTLLLYLNKFTLGWFVVRGLGFDAAYMPTLAVQAVLQLILYAAPTPGGSGIAELSTGALMALVLPTHLLAPFVLAYRFFLTYLPAAVGALVLAHELRPARDVVATARGVVATGVVLTVLASAAAPTGLIGQGGQDPPAVVIIPVHSLGTKYSATDRMIEAVSRVLEEGIMATSRADSLAAFNLAVEIGEELVRIAPEQADGHYLLSAALGQRLELSGTREKIRLGQRCREAAERALEIDPHHPGGHHVLGRLHAGTMRLSVITRFIARKVLGAKALEGASWDVAEGHFLEASTAEPSNPRHWLELASLYIDTDRPDAALEPLRRASAAIATSESERGVIERARSALAALECPRC